MKGNLHSAITSEPEDSKLNELRQPQKDILCHSTSEVSKIVKFMESRSGMMVSGARERKKWEILINENKTSIKQDE